MKIKVVIFVITILLSLNGCSTDVDYKYLYDPEQITSIEIVKVGEMTSETPPTLTLISNIEYTKDFLKDFEEMECSLIFTDPKGLGTNVVAIKFNYKNGEYELISAEGQAHYTVERQFQYYKGYRSFNQEQFDNLISKYTNTNV